MKRQISVLVHLFLLLVLSASGVIHIRGWEPTLSAGYKFPKGNLCCTYCRTE
jgi:hypothetical protein